MAFTVYVQMKKLGKQRGRKLEPIPFILEERPGTVRELLADLTALGVEAYNGRKNEGQILSFLTREEIDGQAARGKIVFGQRGGRDAVAKEAIANTLQCFADGIYRVFAGDRELTKLDEEIPWTKELVFTFVRLTMLAGW